MSVLCIDIGSYSVKFLEIEAGKKSFSLISHREIPLQKVLGQFKPDATIEDIQISIVHSYLENGYDGKVIFQLPSQIITSRYLNLPIANRKKAEMMIPFQLDENLPYPISQAQFTTSLRKRSEGFDGLIAISKLNEFEVFHEKLERNEVLPSLLAAELNYADSFARVHASGKPYAIIDIGHATTKGYFINGAEVVSNHVSHIAGRLIDDVIAKTYTIPLSEAVAYKQANAFFLTDAQYEEVTPEQREFANLMKQTLWPLISEIKRWELGFRVKYGQSVETIYLCGGTSRTNNIANFLSQAIGVRVELLDFQPWVQAQDDRYEENVLSYSLSNMMAISNLDREPVPNFLSGAFANSMASQLPLYSISFLSVRLAALCLLLISFLLVERFAFLNRESKIVDAEVNRLLKTPSLALPITERRYYPSQPERVLQAIKKKTSAIAQEISLVQSATSKRALPPLLEVSQVLAAQKVKVAFFEADAGKARLVITAEQEADLKLAQEALLAANLTMFQTGPGKNEKEVTVTFDY